MDKPTSNNKRLKSIAAICASIYSLVFIFGRQIYLSNGLWVSAKTIVALVALAAIVTIGLFFFFKWFAGIKISGTNLKIKSPLKLWLVNWAVLFICWMPCYLTYYPGLLSYDAPEQICMITGVFPSTTHQPPIHTIILGWAMHLGEHFGIEPIVLYTISQMIITAAIFSYYMLFLMKRFAKKKWEIILIYLFLAINPVVALMAIQPTKDVFFACLYILCAILIYEIVTDSEVKIYKYILLALVIALSALFRNNALYALLAACLVLVLFTKMNIATRFKTIAAVLLAVLLVNVFNNYTTDVLGYKKLDDKVEASAVPLSQLALVMTESPETITEDQWIELSFFIHSGSFMVEAYNPRFYDPLKDALFKTNLQENYGRFLKIWAGVFKNNPVKYVRAFLNLNIPYWYPLAKTMDPYSNRVYIETNIGESPYVFERDSKLPWLLKYYEGVASFSSLDLPILRTIFGINTPIWVILLGIALLIVKRDYKKIMIFMPAFFLWGTYLFGPVSNFRYIYPIFALYPLFFAVVFHSDNKGIEM